MPVQQTEKTIALTHASGATAEIYLFGATVTSWKVAGEEKLFLSQTSDLDGTAPIVGGIPIVFPVFGQPPASPPDYAALPAHGFVREQIWSLDEVLQDDMEGLAVKLSAPPPPETFPHAISVSCIVKLNTNKLAMSLQILNSSQEDEFKFQSLLHPYFRVPDISQVSIVGIGGQVTFKDKVLGGEIFTTTEDVITINRQTDRVYTKVPSREIRINDGAGAGYDVVFSGGFEDCVIWNPAANGNSRMKGLEDGGWNRFVCVEPGYVREFKTIAPRELFVGNMEITVVV